MSTRQASGKTGGWQLILADLALILFLVTLAALAGFGREKRPEPTDFARRAKDHAVAPSQALYRPGTGVPTLGEWLNRQVRDPRATLTIFARYAQGDEDRAWRMARRLAGEAKAEGVAVRVIITEAGAETPGDIHASLAFDMPPTP
jgi:hypothetical protein